MTEETFGAEQRNHKFQISKHIPQLVLLDDTCYVID